MALQIWTATCVVLTFLSSVQAETCPRGKSGQVLPNITLPWGTYCSTLIQEQGSKMYLFKNVRFGEDTGYTHRFKASEYPQSLLYPNTTLGSSSGAACPQIDPSLKCKPGGLQSFPNHGEVHDSEDCLFLDLYVPEKAIDDAKKGVHNTPVVVWFFGGAFVLGSKDFKLGGPDKDPLYSGRGPINAAHGNLIFVAGNYRLGAFGWLAGHTMARQGLPNAGLSDQRLILKWVQDFIGLVGGNKSSVSAWGESAGASSILHHLISHDPQSYTGALLKPNFQRAAIQSPAYEWQWDIDFMEQTYKNFSEDAGCRDHSFTCLQRKSIDELQYANNQLFRKTTPCTGLFPIGPSLDGRIITELSPVAFSGNVEKNFSHLDSIIVSHVTNEAASFLPSAFRNPGHATEDNFTDFLDKFVPELSLQKNLTEDIKARYPLERFKNQEDRVQQIIQDAVFVCNTRQTFDAYRGNSTNYYAMSFDFPDRRKVNDTPVGNLAVHASDLPSLFYNSQWYFTNFMNKTIGAQKPDFGFVRRWAVAKWYTWAIKHVIPAYQTYWANHAQTGNPNRPWNVQLWKPAVLKSGKIAQTRQLQTAGRWLKWLATWGDVEDDQNSATVCDFWLEMAYKVMNETGPPPKDAYIEEKRPAFMDELRLQDESMVSEAPNFQEVLRVTDELKV